jgi:hypothetical protein
MANIENFRFSSSALRATNPGFGEITGALASNRIAASGPVFVDVSGQSTQAQVSRAGFNVGEIAIRPDVLDDILDTRPVIVTKVVSQSIAAGTAVARGTAIDIVLTRTDDLPIRVIPGIHEAFTEFTVQNVFSQFEGNATVRDIIRRRTDVSQLTADEQTQLTSQLNANGVNIGTEATNNLGSAFNALQAAFTFQG